MSRLSFVLFAIIFIEGYAVLASELIAIRLLIPFVGSGVEVVAIIVSAVLLPLATGYHVGGQRYEKALALARSGGEKRSVPIRKLLIRNLLNATIALTFGLSYIVQKLFFGAMDLVGISHLLLQATLYCAVFLIYPVFLLAQTVPLAANYFSHGRLSQLTGRMLFFSTLGSFAGSIISTLLLMNLIGVHQTAIVVIALLFVTICLLCRNWHAFDIWIAGMMLAIMMFLNSNALMSDLKIVSNNAYNTVSIRKEDSGQSVVMSVNHSYSSKYSANEELRFKYVRFLEESILKPSKRPLEVLVIGGGGMTIGYDQAKHHITYVDIDAALEELADSRILPKGVASHQKFEARSARAFLRTHQQAYDVIIVDAYTNKYSIPMETTTVEFWQQVDAHLKPNGVVAANIIADPMFESRFDMRISNTFSAVFPHHLRQAPSSFSVWDEHSTNNLIFLHRKNANRGDSFIYTDDLNTYSLDKYR